MHDSQTSRSDQKFRNEGEGGNANLDPPLYSSRPHEGFGKGRAVDAPDLHGDVAGGLKLLYLEVGVAVLKLVHVDRACEYRVFVPAGNDMFFLEQ